MKIELHMIKVRDLVEGYEDNGEEGVVAYGGKLDVRPPYQREFVYKDEQRDAVIDTVRKGYPLNIMYWVKTGEDSYEILDGQQRTVSICTYLNSEFSINYRNFHGLTQEEKEDILNYELTIYICEGTEKEKLEWFRVVNIAGEKLTDQELRNTVYTGRWLTDAKRHFSKSSSPAKNLAGDFMSGNPLRQDYLEQVLKWVADRDNTVIEGYMSDHQLDSNANDLWLYFNSVMRWAQTLFPVVRKKEMRKVEWGFLYNKYHEKQYDADELEELVSSLMKDVDVIRKQGIYYYVFDGDERHLNIRLFNDRQKREAYERQDGTCVACQEKFDISQMEGDHIVPWSRGGKTVSENCQMLCVNCNRTKSNV